MARIHRRSRQKSSCLHVLSHQSCLTLCNPMDCSPPGSSVHGIFQARVLEWVTMPSSRGSSQSGDQTQVSCIAGGFFTVWATRRKVLPDPDNHNGVVTHLEPDILECDVKWALGTSTMNKVRGGDGIPAELFQILKDDAVLKCCTRYASKFGKLSSSHRTGKGQFSFQSQKKAMPKNAQTTTQLHSSHTLAK